MDTQETKVLIESKDIKHLKKKNTGSGIDWYESPTDKPAARIQSIYCGACYLFR